MTVTLKKIEKYWVTIIEREDGTWNHYRFNSKSEAKKWAKLVGIKF